MKKILFLSDDDPAVEIADDNLAAEPLAELGFEVQTRPWTSVVDWSSYSAVVIRSTWDYWKVPDRFLSTLENITVPLFNDAKTVRWNYDKSYLEEFEDMALPSHFHPGGEIASALLEQYAHRYGALVVKPTVGLGGFDVVIWHPGEHRPRHLDSERQWMIQPLADSIYERGELSLMYFQGEFSHAVQKLAGQGEFRIHEHFGGRNQSVEPDSGALDLGRRVVARLPQVLLYLRVDLVHYDGQWRLMEVEAIEPSLFLAYHPDAPRKFAAAIAQRLKTSSSV